MEKRYKLKVEQIKQLIPDLGFALATEKITVDGKKVDYMIREEPHRVGDSGWIFYGGGETQEYLDDINNTSLHDLNTIANYDPDIIRFLSYPVGTEIERNQEGVLAIIHGSEEEPEKIFLPPLEIGRINITKNWSFELSTHMLRRVEGGSLVLWRPGFTIWLDSFKAQSEVEKRIKGVLDTMSPESKDLLNLSEKGFHKMRYRLDEETGLKTQAASYIFAFSEHHEIHMAIYFEDENDMSNIDNIWNSLEHKTSQ